MKKISTIIAVVVIAIIGLVVLMPTNPKVEQQTVVKNFLTAACKSDIGTMRNYIYVPPEVSLFAEEQIKRELKGVSFGLSLLSKERDGMKNITFDDEKSQYASDDGSNANLYWWMEFGNGEKLDGNTRLFKKDDQWFINASKK